MKNLETKTQSGPPLPHDEWLKAQREAEGTDSVKQPSHGEESKATTHRTAHKTAK